MLKVPRQYPHEPLMLVAEGAAGRRYPLADGKLILGRGVANAIEVGDPDVCVRHAQLLVSQGRVTVRDLNSQSGTYVNERRIESPVPLRPGDILRVGARRLRLEGPRRHEVLILGGGFGGVYVALELQKQLHTRRDVGVTLISRDNYFLFQPMLPEVVSGSIEAPHILNPLRRLLTGVQVLTGEVECLDLATRVVQIGGTGEGAGFSVTFDSLVLALGSITDLSRLPGVAEHAFQLTTIGDAFAIRNHALDMLEQADAEGDPDERARLLTFVVAGGGFSGVEVVAELADLLDDAVRYYPGLDRSELHLELVQSGARILPEVGETLAAFAKGELARKGIHVRTQSGVAAATATEVVLRDGTRVPTRTLIATIGNRPHPLLETLPSARTERGAVQVDEYLHTDQPGVWALGDLAAVPDQERGGLCPPTAQYASRQARTLARNVLATLDGQPPSAFRFGALGQLAALGRGSAVAEVGGRQLSGWVAWWLWRAVYLGKLPGLERRLRVLADWMHAAFLPRDTVRLQLARSGAVTRLHYLPGQTIVRQGDTGARFYIVVTGRVAVVRDGPDGDVPLAELGRGEHFGELALLQSGRRTATVRAITPVDVLSIERNDFLALVTTGPFFHDLEPATCSPAAIGGSNGSCVATAAPQPRMARAARAEDRACWLGWWQPR